MIAPTGGTDPAALNWSILPGFVSSMRLRWPEGTSVPTWTLQVPDVGIAVTSGTDGVLSTFDLDEAQTGVVAGLEWVMVDELGVVQMAGRFTVWQGRDAVPSQSVAVQLGSGSSVTVALAAVGPKGDTGLVGPVGPPGTGATGAVGPVGPVGPAGSSSPLVEEFRVWDYEAATGGNTQAAVVAAVAAAQAAPAGALKIVKLRSGATYTFDTVTAEAGGALRYCVAITGDNIWIDLNGATVNAPTTLPNVTVVLFNAAGRTGGTDALSYVNWATRATSYRINTAVKGATTVAMTTPADAAQFAVDDWVFIRAGQTITNPYGGDDQPDSEPNRVTAVNTATGVVTLRWPTAKPYRQEWRTTTGGAGTPTTPTANANATVYPSMAKVTDRWGSNVRLFGGTILAPVAAYQAFFLHYYDWQARDITGTYNGGTPGGQLVRHGLVENITGQRVGVNPGGTAAIAGGAVGTVDAVFRHVRHSGGVSALHLHEGCAQVLIEDFALEMPDSTETGGMGISILARAYDATIRRGTIIGGSYEPAITVGADCAPGVISDVTCVSSKPDPHLAVSVAAPGWTLTDVDVVGGFVAVHPQSTLRSRGQQTALNTVGARPGLKAPAAVRRLVSQWGFEFVGLRGSNVSTPDSAAVSIVGDQDVSVLVAAGTNTRPTSGPGTLKSKFGATGQISWAFQLLSTGALVFYWSENGTALRAVNSNTGALPAVLDRDTWGRVKFDVSIAGSHSVQFQTSIDKVTWTNLGSAQTATGGGVTSIFDSTAPVDVGSYADGTGVFIGGIIAAEIRNGIDGPVVASLARPDATATTWVAATGETWTVNGPVGTVAGSDVTLSADRLVDGTTIKAFLASERTKLAGIAAGATANSTDAYLLNRDNHTGAQAQSTVTGLVPALAAKADLVSGTVPASQLPSYVDDIIESTTFAALPATGETGKLYVVLATGVVYRWSGSAYAEVSASLVLGTTPGTAADAGTVALLTGAQTIAGVKTFSSSPSVPTPALAGDAAPKGYVDAADGTLVPQSLVDAKGDLLIATADNTVARHAAPANGNMLVPDSTATDGWAEQVPHWKRPNRAGAWLCASSYPAALTLASAVIGGGTRYMPFDLYQARTFDQWALFVSVLGVLGSGGTAMTAKIGLYASDVDGQVTGNPILSVDAAPAVDLTSGGGAVNTLHAAAFASPITIPAGRYWPSVSAATSTWGTTPTNPQTYYVVLTDPRIASTSIASVYNSGFYQAAATTPPSPAAPSTAGTFGWAVYLRQTA